MNLIISVALRDQSLVTSDSMTRYVAFTNLPREHSTIFQTTNFIQLFLKTLLSEFRLIEFHLFV